MSKLREIREILAKLEHDQWCEWSKDLAKKEKLSPERLERWKKLWKPYSELTEEEKDQDRVYADKVMSFLGTLDIEDHQDLLQPMPLDFKKEYYSLDPAVIAEPKKLLPPDEEEILALSEVHDFMNSILMEHIVKLPNGQYRLKSKKTGRNLGTFSSRKQAVKREGQIEYFKRKK